MSKYSNLADASKQDRAAYVDSVLELVGDKDPLEILGATVETIRSQTANLTQESLSRPEVPGKWSILEMMQHLADAELVWSFRLRKVIAEDRPALAGYDQNRWAEQLGYKDADFREVLELFSVLRRANLKLLYAQGPAVFTRVAVHAERGEETLQKLLKLFAGHDLAHLNQLERIKKRLT